MLEFEVLVGKGFGAVDGGAAGTVAVQKVAALDHEVFDLQGVVLIRTKINRKRKKKTGKRLRGRTAAEGVKLATLTSG